ncbi:hypothetical protein AADG42_13190 [Ammonicoccus fulvus]|uniref:Class C sortase n=1 Tax=Ammonicoccus fulvus TaxID=3138240 RepID=A0ABZ3FS44_9ACTN
MTQTLEQPRHAAGEPRRKPVRRWPHRMVPILLILLGVLVIIYPIIATEYNNYRQQEFARKYLTQVNETDPNTRNEDLERARTYNATLPHQAL